MCFYIDRVSAYTPYVLGLLKTVIGVYIEIRHIHDMYMYDHGNEIGGAVADPGFLAWGSNSFLRGATL